MDQNTVGIIGVVALAVVFVIVKLLVRGGTAKFFPKGDPAADRANLAAWWSAEAAKAGLTGAVEVTHATHEEAARQALPFWKQVMAGNLFTPELPLQATQVYTARLPDSRALAAHVFTAADGTICRVVFEAAVKRTVAGELVYKKNFVSVGDLLGPGAKFEGPGAEALNASKELLSAADATLTVSYIPPGGLENKLVSKAGSLALVPASQGSTLLVDTLPRSAGVGSLDFGLDSVLTLRRRLDG